MVARKKTSKRISWRTVAVLFLCVSTLFGYLLYEFSPPQIHGRFTVSDVLDKELSAYVKSDSRFVGIQVAPMQLSRNTRYVSYTYIVPVELRKLYSVFTQTYVSGTTPIFSNDTEIANMRMVRLINHEFVCTPYKETASYRYFPIGIAYVSTVCSVSIPASYGHISGLLHIYIDSEPTALDKIIIQSRLKGLSEKIFLEMPH